MRIRSTAITALVITAIAAPAAPAAPAVEPNTGSGTQVTSVQPAYAPAHRAVVSERNPAPVGAPDAAPVVSLVRTDASGFDLSSAVVGALILLALAALGMAVASVVTRHRNPTTLA